MNPDSMKHPLLVAFLVCAASLATQAEAILGRFQPEDEVARAVVGLTGPARLNLNAVRIVDLAGRKGEIQLMYFVNGVIDEVLESGQYRAWYDESRERAARLGL